MKKIKYGVMILSSLLLFACNNGTEHIAPANKNLKFTSAGLTGSTCDTLPEWKPEVTYTPGGIHVVYKGYEYENAFWTQGDNPQDTYGDKGTGRPWIQLTSCGDAPKPDPDPTPSTSPDPDPKPSPTTSPPPPAPGDHPIYPQERGMYVGGTIVQSPETGKLYECLSDTVAPWCNSAAEWAYAPGTGSASDSAWKEVGSGPKPDPIPSPTTSPNPDPKPSPTTSPGPDDESSATLFSPYKDVTLWITGRTKISTNVTGQLQPVSDVLAAHKANALTMAFAIGECGNEVWNNTTSDVIASNAADYNAKGIKYIISTGGFAGKFTCSSNAGMDKFYNKYQSKGLLGLDFDIETAYSQAEVNSMIAAIAHIQKLHPNLNISFTLATEGNGSGSINGTGAQFINAAKAAGIRYTVNLMVMDYYSSCTVVNGKCDMNISAQNAAVALHKAYNIPYTSIELTPMIGINDNKVEVFSLDDAKNLATWIKSEKLAGMHYWAMDRDTNVCSNSEIASWDCSGIIGKPEVQSKPLEFMDVMISTLGSGTPPGPKPTPTDEPPGPAPTDEPPAPGPASGQNIVGYWGSWSTNWGDANSLGIANIPSYVNTVLIAFVQPSCNHAAGRLDCGLQFSMDMAAVRGAIDNAHKKNPNQKFLLSIGGANYPFSQPMTSENAKSLVTLMNEMGADGLDLDYETHPSCTGLDTAQLKCNTDAEVIQLINTLKAALPKDKLLTAATWSVGAYGNDKFPVSKYQPQSDYSGMFINPLKQVGNKLDEIFIMSYDAGSLTGTGYNPKQALDAYSAIFPKAKTYLGLEIPYEAWPNHITGQAQVLTISAAMDYATYAKQQGAGGVMIWSLNKVSDVNGETANDYLKPICTAYGLSNCDKAIPIK